MEIKKITVGPLGTNCYIVSSEKEGVIIDPGDVPKKILENVGDIKIKYVVLTHNHFDHVGGVDMVCEKLGAKLMLHKDDTELYCNVPEMFHFSSKPVNPRSKSSACNASISIFSISSSQPASRAIRLSAIMYAFFCAGVR